MGKPKVVIVIARCSRTQKIFGIRMEQVTEKQWLADWAFPIKESVAQKEGYSQQKISGSFGFAPSYPGCPYCEARSLFQCTCNRNACWDRRQKNVVCPWCNSTIELGGVVTELITGEDR